MKKVCGFAVLAAMGWAMLVLSCSKKAAENDGILNVMIEVEVSTLDPALSMDGTSNEVVRNLYDGLKQKIEGGKLVDALGTDEQISADGLTYTFKIRKGAQWANGDPVTADDFVFGWRRVVDPKVASEYAYMLTSIGQVKNAAKINRGELPVEALGITAIDKETLKIELEVPVPYFDQVLSSPTLRPVNQAFYEKVGAAYATSPETTLSNGPFVLAEYQPATTSFLLVKNEKYWDAANVKAKGIRYQVVKDSQQSLLSYRNGDLDIVNIAGDQVEQVLDDPEFRSFRSGFLWYIVPNISSGSELADVNLRKAISWAIDRKSLVEDVVKDGSTEAFLAVPSGYAYSADGEDFSKGPTEFSDLGGYDPQKALQYYNEAKRALKQDSFTFEFLADDPTVQQNVAAVIKDQLERTLPGLTLNITVKPKKQRTADMRSGNFEIGLTRWGPDYDDPMTYLGMWVTSNSHNYGRWSNKTFDDLIYKCTNGEYVLDFAKRWSTLKDAERIVLEDVAIIPLYEHKNAVLIKKNVSGVVYLPARILKGAHKD